MRFLKRLGVGLVLLIATFLGLLEMIKNLVISAEQEGRFGPIWLRLVDENVDEAIADLAEMYGPGSAARSADEDGSPGAPSWQTDEGSGDAGTPGGTEEMGS